VTDTPIDLHQMG